jgi:hypothetical protein
LPIRDHPPVVERQAGVADRRSKKMEESLMSEKKSNSKQLPGFRISPVVLIRLSSILVVLLMIGHTSAYPWASTHGLQEIQLVGSMKSVEFEFLG